MISWHSICQWLYLLELQRYSTSPVFILWSSLDLYYQYLPGVILFNLKSEHLWKWYKICDALKIKEYLGKFALKVCNTVPMDKHMGIRCKIGSKINRKRGMKHFKFIPWCDAKEIDCSIAMYTNHTFAVNSVFEGPVCFAFSGELQWLCFLRKPWERIYKDW